MSGTAEYHASNCSDRTRCEYRVCITEKFPGSDDGVPETVGPDYREDIFSQVSPPVRIRASSIRLNTPASHCKEKTNVVHDQQRRRRDRTRPVLGEESQAEVLNICRLAESRTKGV